MPKILDRLVSQLQAKGKSKKSAFAIATAVLQRSGNLKKGTQKATSKRKRRGAMTPSQRAKSRAAKRSGKSPGAYKYNPKTNQAKLK